MKEIEDIPSRLIGLILQVSPRTYRNLKLGLVDAIANIPGDDRIFLFSPHMKALPRNVGETVASIANYSPVDLDLRMAIRDTLQVINDEDDDCTKLLFVVVDKFSSQELYGVSKSLRLNQMYDVGCKITICTIGDRCDSLKGIEGCDVIKFSNTEEFGKYMKGLHVGR